MSKNILVGFDGSEPAQRAAHRAAVLAKKLGMGLHVVCVVPPVWLPTADFTGQLYDQLREAQTARARGVIEDALAGLKDAGVPLESSISEGPPADQLAQLSESEEIDFIAVGATSQGRIARVLLGSVANRLLQLARKPVLVVP